MGPMKVMQYTVRLGYSDLEILERKGGERVWNNILKEFYHELPQFEMDKEWEKLTKEKEKTVYKEFSPPKAARVSDKIDNENVEKKSPTKNVEASVESNKRKERTPEGKDPKS